MEGAKGYDIIGDIAILRFDSKAKSKDKKKIAGEFLKERKNLGAVLEKTEKIKGKLRIFKTRWLEGGKKTETIHKENNCLFKIDVSKCYFSPRLSGERLEIANKIKKNERVLVMFAGVSPYAIAISKISKAKKIVSIELGRECCRLGRENVNLNRAWNVEILQGDVKRIVPRLKDKFDSVVMPRPQLKESFLKEAFLSVKRGGRIFYRAFGSEDELAKSIEKIEQEASKRKLKIKILSVKKSGDIAPRVYRWMIEVRVR